jgi:hypothetical protein
MTGAPSWSRSRPASVRGCSAHGPGVLSEPALRSRYPDSSEAERVVALLTELADILASGRDQDPLAVAYLMTCRFM